jgi:hypothetical protein
MGEASQPVQRLKKSKDVNFKSQPDKRAGTILQNLDDYHQHRQDKAEDHQGRLRGLADLRENLHAWFKENKDVSLKDIPNGEELHDLYREIEAEHTQAITAIKGTDESPIDTRGMEKEEVQNVQKLWKSIVGGKGNLQIGGGEDFQNERLADIALLLQKPGGRELVEQLDADQGSKDMNVRIAPSFSHEELGGSQEPEGSYAFPLSEKDARIHYDKKAVAKTKVAGGKVPEAVTAKAFQGDNSPFSIEGGEGAFQFGKGSGSLVKIAPEDPSVVYADKDLDATLSPRFLTLGHELGHAHKNLRGASFNAPGTSQEFFDQTGQDELTRKLWSHDAEEVVNITSVENTLRDEHGLTPRQFHTDQVSARHEIGQKKLEDKLYEAWNKVPQNLRKRRELGYPLNQIQDALRGKNFSDPEAVKLLDNMIKDFDKELPETIERARLHQVNDDLEKSRRKEFLLEDFDIDFGFKPEDFL